MQIGIAGAWLTPAAKGGCQHCQGRAQCLTPPPNFCSGRFSLANARPSKCDQTNAHATRRQKLRETSIDAQTGSYARDTLCVRALFVRPPARDRSVPLGHSGLRAHSVTTTFLHFATKWRTIWGPAQQGGQGSLAYLFFRSRTGRTMLLGITHEGTTFQALPAISERALIPLICRVARN